MRAQHWFYADLEVKGANLGDAAFQKKKAKRLNYRKLNKFETFLQNQKEGSKG